MTAKSATLQPGAVNSFPAPGALAPTESTIALCCRKCTREIHIPCDSREAGLRIAYDMGWRDVQREPWALAAFGQAFVCSRCPGGNRGWNFTLEEARVQEALREKALDATRRAIADAAIAAGNAKPGDVLALEGYPELGRFIA